jgi:predicted CXXCH cytochrome family protein
MKVIKTPILVIFALAVMTTFAWARYPKSNILNSAHDLRSTFGAASYAVCNFCHVAHKSEVVPSNAPGPLLWNHTMSSKASYGSYSSDSFNLLNPTISDLGGKSTVSNLCLSCHDGTVAVNSWYVAILGTNFQPLTQGTTFMPTDTRINDMTKQHPLHFLYDTGLATAYGTGLLQPASTRSVDAAGEVPLYSGYMECATCHDPHNGKSGIFVRNFPTQASGSFCTYCHT